MEYRQLGKSGLKISALSFGSWLTFGEELDIQLAKTCMKYAFEQGINFFDNAEVYGGGKSEEVMGTALKQFRRESLVVSTKIFWGGGGPNDIGLSRKHLIEGTKNSLKRLQLEYIDLLFCHRPDPSTPIEETVLAMDYLVRSGYTLYWGTSEWSSEQVTAAYQSANDLRCIPPTMEQPQYNLFHRQRVEEEYNFLYQKYGLGLTVWSPLAYGLLSGKYNQVIPTNSRLAKHPMWQPSDMEERIAKIKKLIPITKELGCTLAQLAIAWCLKKPEVSSVILGASSLNQLEENLGALSIYKRLTDNIMERIEAMNKL